MVVLTMDYRTTVVVMVGADWISAPMFVSREVLVAGRDALTGKLRVAQNGILKGSNPLTVSKGRAFGATAVAKFLA